MNYFKIAVFFLITFSCQPLSAQITEKNYKIYSIKLAKEVSINDIVEDLKYYDVLFYGEEHNDSVTHFLEHKILESLFAKYSNTVTLSMEMFERDVQPIMNEYLTSDVREKNFKKDARVWSNYKDYRPMIEFSKLNKLDVICANAASVNAEAMLKFVYNTNYFEYLSLPNASGNNNRMISTNDNVSEVTQSISLFKLYPNPANQSVTIQFVAEETYSAMQMMVYDITGKVVITQTVKDNLETININNLTSGMYLVTMVADGKVIGKQKLIKE